MARKPMTPEEKAAWKEKMAQARQKKAAERAAAPPVKTVVVPKKKPGRPPKPAAPAMEKPAPTPKKDFSDNFL